MKLYLIQITISAYIHVLTEYLNIKSADVSQLKFTSLRCILYTEERDLIKGIFI